MNTRYESSTLGLAAAGVELKLDALEPKHVEAVRVYLNDIVLRRKIEKMPSPFDRSNKRRSEITSMHWFREL